MNHKLIHTYTLANFKCLIIDSDSKLYRLGCIFANGEIVTMYMALLDIKT